MGLEDILQDIDRDTKRKLLDISTREKSETDKIIKEGKAEADKILGEAKKRGETESEAIRKREIAIKNGEMKRAYQNAVSQAVSDSIGEIYNNFDEFRKDDLYKKLLRGLCEKAVSLLGENCSITAVKKDERLMIGIKAKNVEYDDKMIGGIFAYSEDGRMEVDYSLKSIIEGIEAELLRGVSDRLYLGAD